jgi:hypothetical protein
MEKYDVGREKILSQIKNEVEIAYIFGSFIELKNSKFRDIDLALVTSPSVTPNNFTNEKIAQRIAKDLERSIEPRCEFDVKIINSAPITFQYGVIKNGIPIFSRDEMKRIEYEASVISEYLDYKETDDFLINNLIKVKRG